MMCNYIGSIVVGLFVIGLLVVAYMFRRLYLCMRAIQGPDTSFFSVAGQVFRYLVRTYREHKSIGKTISNIKSFIKVLEILSSNDIHFPDFKQYAQLVYQSYTALPYDFPNVNRRAALQQAISERLITSDPDHYGNVAKFRTPYDFGVAATTLALRNYQQAIDDVNSYWDDSSVLPEICDCYIMPLLAKDLNL